MSKQKINVFLGIKIFTSRVMKQNFDHSCVLKQKKSAIERNSLALNLYYDMVKFFSKPSLRYSKSFVSELFNYDLSMGKISIMS